MEAKPAPPTINPFNICIKKEEIKIFENIPLLISYEGDFIKFKVSIPYDFFKKEYELIVSFEQFKEINNYFKIFNDLNEIYTNFINEYKNGRISFKINENEIKIIILNAIINSTFEINIPKIYNLPNSSDLYNILLEMHKRIKNLELENKNLKIQVEENKSKIKFLENYLKIYTNTKTNMPTSFATSTPLSTIKFDYFSGSNIINTENDINLLLNFLPQKPSKITILFNSLIHGDSIESLHSKVLNKTPTYIIIKSQNDRIFGGYTTHIWNEKNKDIFSDINAFVFSLDNRKKYKIIKVSNAIVETDTYIQFGTCCFRINTNCTAKENLEEDCDYETNGYCLSGENNFLIKSYEVFFVEY